MKIEYSISMSRLWMFAALGLTLAAPARADPTPEQVLRRYFALLGRHDYAAALRLRLNDMPPRRFAGRPASRCMRTSAM